VRIPKSPPRKITKEDAHLAESAKKKAGGASALAKLFGVTAAAASEWGRARPIPRHLRPRIEEYLGSAGTARTDDQALASRRNVLKIQEILLRRTPELDGLPSRYRERYQERVKAIELRVAANLDEIAANIERELADVRAWLIAEHRAQRRASS
jgi:hypothetical protein